jgi:hypothetical protein
VCAIPRRSQRIQRVAKHATENFVNPGLFWYATVACHNDSKRVAWQTSAVVAHVFSLDSLHTRSVENGLFSSNVTMKKTVQPYAGAVLYVSVHVHDGLPTLSHNRTMATKLVYTRIWFGRNPSTVHYNVSYSCVNYPVHCAL